MKFLIFVTGLVFLFVSTICRDEDLVKPSVDPEVGAARAHDHAPLPGPVVADEGALGQVPVTNQLRSLRCLPRAPPQSHPRTVRIAF